MRSSHFQIFLFLFSCLFLSNCTKENILSDTPVVVDTAIQNASSRSNNVDLKGFESYLQDEMKEQHIPAMSVLLFREDEVLYEGYFGKSNIQQNIPLQKDHLFLLASVSKVVTATALLQLYEQGHFKLDDNINNYLDFEVSVPRYREAITFKMLLTHTSGIADGPALDDQYYYGKDSPIELSYFLENYLSPKGIYYNKQENFHAFRPGSQQEYTNTGAALIGLLVSKISGIDFSDYCQQNIFKPLGMTNTAWHLANIDQFIVQPYDYHNRRYQAIDHYTFTDYPNGGLRSTTRDLFQFLSAFVQNGRSNQYQLLKASTVKAMTQQQIPTISDDTGLHLFQMDYYENLWGHDGGEQGVATTMAFNQDTKVGAIILSNQGEAELEDILLEAYYVGLEL